MVLRLFRLSLIALGACQAAFPITEDGGHAVPCGKASCEGNCCVTMGATDYEFACKPAGDPCTGAQFDLACDDSSQCPKQRPICCYAQTFAPDRAETACVADCSAFNRMCHPGGVCPPSMTCQPWFASYRTCK